MFMLTIGMLFGSTSAFSTENIKITKTLKPYKSVESKNGYQSLAGKINAAITKDNYKDPRLFFEKMKKKQNR